MVANHVSWLDIFLLAAQGHVRFVAKSDIQSWPLISWLARSVGTLYIRRGRGGAGPLLQQVMPLVQVGQSFVFFPEGTTTDGSRLKPFHARLFAAATDSGLAIAPTPISFGPAWGGRNLAPFIGDDTLVAHLLRMLANPGLQARVIYAPLLPSAQHTPQTLAAAAQEAVAQALDQNGFGSAQSVQVDQPMASTAETGAA
jgi:1-acyl-sn-glycerol-3-phosphate acyltransferase